jgi:hypothetical protein
MAVCLLTNDWWPWIGTRSRAVSYDQPRGLLHTNRHPFYHRWTEVKLVT